MVYFRTFTNETSWDKWSLHFTGANLISNANRFSKQTKKNSSPHSLTASSGLTSALFSCWDDISLTVITFLGLRIAPQLTEDMQFGGFHAALIGWTIGVSFTLLLQKKKLVTQVLVTVLMSAWYHLILHFWHVPPNNKQNYMGRVHFCSRS